MLQKYKICISRKYIQHYFLISLLFLSCCILINESSRYGISFTYKPLIIIGFSFIAGALEIFYPRNLLSAKQKGGWAFINGIAISLDMIFGIVLIPVYLFGLNSSFSSFQMSQLIIASIIFGGFIGFLVGFIQIFMGLVKKKFYWILWCLASHAISLSVVMSISLSLSQGINFVNFLAGFSVLFSVLFGLIYSFITQLSLQHCVSES
jgi:hypothetical protein